MPPLLPLCRVLVVAGRLALTAGPFFGEKLTIADLCATGLCRMILTGNFDHIPASWLAENFPRLMVNATACSRLSRWAECSR